MAKFRIRLKLQGLELEVDGEREDIPLISSAVQRQLTGLIQPAEAIAHDRKNIDGLGRITDTDVARKPNRKRNPAGKSTGDGGQSQTIEFRHDASTYVILSSHGPSSKNVLGCSSSSKRLRASRKWRDLS